MCILQKNVGSTDKQNQTNLWMLIIHPHELPNTFATRYISSSAFILYVFLNKRGIVVHTAF